MEQRLLSAKESAKYLGVGLTTFYEKLKGRFNPIRILGNKSFYDKVELDRFIEAHKRDQAESEEADG